MVTYTDEEIDDLIHTPKAPVGDRTDLPRLRDTGMHARATALSCGDDGNEFRVVLRRSRANALDFSVILAVRVPRSNRWFRLRRYNGRSHIHRNRIEGTTVTGFHIHTATERYQRSGRREDAYAESATTYGDYEGALRCLIAEAKLAIAPRLNFQARLFPEERP